MSASNAKPKPHGLYAKILTVQKAIESIPKRGFNAFHKYHYATEADILTVKQTLNAHGLMVLPTTLEQATGTKADGKNWASVTLLFRVVDAETGEAIDSQFTGYAEDAFDKAIYKATTGANKYFYLKFFGIATEDDPEREDAPLGESTPNKSVPTYSKVNSSTKASSTQRGRPAGERSTTEPSTASGSRALSIANQILALQREHSLSNQEVLQWAEIPSVKVLAEEDRVAELGVAYQKLKAHLSQTSGS